MADIFISYKSERRRAAEHLAAVLERYGYSVWFDYQLIKGRDFGLQIDRKVREAKALVVLWCSMSVDSRWVAEEVDLAQELGILIPVKIEPCTLRVGFRRQDYIDLSEWDGAPRSHRLDPLFDALEQKIGRPPADDYKALREYEATWRRFGALPLKAFAFDQPPEAHEGDRGLPDRAGSKTPNAESPSNGEQHSRVALAAQEWPFVRDSGDPRRLLRFEKHFAGTYYAEEARELREATAGKAKEAEAKELAARQQAEVARRKAEGMVQVRIGDGPNDEVRWLRPGSGERFKDFPAAPEMVVVPAGEFLMGSRGRDGSGDERPQHKVAIVRPFAVGCFPVAFDEWDAAHTRGGVWHHPADAGWGRGRRPVINVSWEDAKSYVGWLSRETGKDYRLLSEAEWEYCCRAGTVTQYAFGDTLDDNQAQFAARRTTETGRFPANAWGLHDMHGNVWEWCEDNWHPSYKGAPDDGSVWPGGDASLRVLRGGSWYGIPQFLRSALRFGDQPVSRNYDVGFRVARTLSPPAS
jgi:formylglycine-generating enzyme required for sulfatase activity